MKHIVLTFATACLLAIPAQSQDAAEDEGFSLMEEGAKLFFKGIMREMEPALNDLSGLVDEMEPALKGFMLEMGPAFAEILGKIDNLSAYQLPEILPNGDIIMRHKTPEEMALDKDGEIDI